MAEPDRVADASESAGGLGRVEQRDPPARTQDPHTLTRECREVGEVAQCESARDAVGAGIGHRELERIGEHERRDDARVVQHPR